MENKTDANSFYTLAIWNVKSGMEKEFINEWAAFAKWINNTISETGTGYLLQDMATPLKFISFGPWSNEQTMQQWGENNEFRNHVIKLIELCDDFQPNNLKVVSSSD